MKLAAVCIFAMCAACAFAEDSAKIKIDFNITLEENADAPPIVTPVIKLIRNTDQKYEALGELSAGESSIEVPDMPDGRHTFYVAAEGFAPQTVLIAVSNHEAIAPGPTLTLYRLRYVVVRFAFNKKGERELSGEDVEEGRLALTHWTGAPHFNEDWQIWQGVRARSHAFGDRPMIMFHRVGTKEFGISEAAVDSFDEMKTAPAIEETKYQLKSCEIMAGKRYFFRILGNEGTRKPAGYGKMEIEEITLTPPKDTEIKLWQDAIKPKEN